MTRPNTPHHDKAQTAITEQKFCLGEWVIDPEGHRLVQITSEGRVERKIEPKVMEVLLQLVRHPGRTVARQALLDAVWGDVVVVERVVNRTIWELRRALDDDAREPRYIETIPKRGYRLLAEVTPFPEPAPSPTVGSRRPLNRGWGLLILLLVALGLVMFWMVWSNRAPQFHSGHDATAVAPMQARLLTSRPGWEYDPALSPDGRQLIFAAQNPDTASWDLFRLELDSAATTSTEWQPWITEPGSEGHPAWSPDGERLAFYRYRKNGTSLHIRELDGSERRLLSVRADYPELAWSPQGHHLAFSQHLEPAAGPKAIYSTAVDTDVPSYGEAPRQLTAPPASWYGDSYPRFSPDGRWLAFTRSRGEGIDDLYLLVLATGEERRLTDDAMPKSGLDWQDERTLLYGSRVAGSADLWRLVLDPEGHTLGEPVRLGLSGWQPGHPSWRDVESRGARLVFIHWSSDINLWRFDLTTEAEPTVIVDSTRWDLDPAISPDGQTIAFSSDRSGHYEIWTVDARGRQAQQRTRFSGSFTSHPRWSPDGQRLLFDVRPEGHADLFELELMSSKITPRIATPADEQHGFYAPDGETIFFASNRGGAWQIWRRDAAGAERWITQDGGFAPQISRDGQLIYYLKPLSGGLWRARLDGSDETLIHSPWTLADAGAWAVTNSGIALVERRRETLDGGRILLLDPDSGGRREIPVDAKAVPSYDGSLAVAPDDTWLILGQRHHPDSELYLLELPSPP